MLATVGTYIVKNRVKEFILSFYYSCPPPYYNELSLFRIPKHGPRSVHYLGPRNMVQYNPNTWCQKCVPFRTPKHGPRSVHCLGPQICMVPGVSSLTGIDFHLVPLELRVMFMAERLCEK